MTGSKPCDILYMKARRKGVSRVHIYEKIVRRVFSDKDCIVNIDTSKKEVMFNTLNSDVCIKLKEEEVKEVARAMKK